MGAETVEELTAETREWLRRELDRREREEPPGGVEETLLPEDRFSDEYAPDDGSDGEFRGPRSKTVGGVLAFSCAGWPEKPDAAELYEAMRNPQPTERQKAIANVMVIEATHDEILLAHLEGAYTWRQLARAIHRIDEGRSRLARYVNLWAGS